MKIGLIAVGLNTYWHQFGGLRERLDGYRNAIKEKMEAYGGQIVADAGMVDDVDKAHAAAALFRRDEAEVLFIFISTYALSSTLIPFLGEGIPVVLLNLQPAPAIDYARLNGMSDRGEMTGEWLANCQACSLPEFCSVFNRAGTKYDVVTGYLDDAQAWAEIYGWIDAAKVACGMRRNRMGLLGNYYGGMVDVYSDLRLQSTVFGTHAEILEMCELHELRRSVTQREADARVAAFGEAFVIDEGCTREELERAARTSVALDKLAEAHRLGSLAYYYAGAAGNAYEDIVTSVIAGNTLLTGRGIPVAGEYEVKNVQAMKIMSLLGAGGCFSEFYGMDFTDDVILLGHDGPAHFLLGEEKARLVPLPVYHGKPGKGLSIQMSVKHGPVTLLSVVEGRDGISFLLAEGESVPGPVLNIGNINSRYRFPLPAREFIDRWSKAGPSHHCAIGVGHVAGAIRKYAALLGIPVTVVCRGGYRPGCLRSRRYCWGGTPSLLRKNVEKWLGVSNRSLYAISATVSSVVSSSSLARRNRICERYCAGEAPAYCRNILRNHE